MRKIILLIFVTVNLYSQELIIGEERVEPGIVFIFEGAVKDEVYPMSVNLLKIKQVFILKLELIGILRKFLKAHLVVVSFLILK